MNPTDTQIDALVHDCLGEGGFDVRAVVRAALERWGCPAEAPAKGLSDNDLIAAATEAGLCYPQCWDFTSQPERLEHLRSFAHSIIARCGNHFQYATNMVSPAPAPAEGEVAILARWMRDCAGSAQRNGYHDAENMHIRIAELLENQFVFSPVQVKGKVANAVADLHAIADILSAKERHLQARKLTRAADLLRYLPIHTNGEAKGPVAWMCPAEPYFDGSKWHDKWQTTMDRKLAECWARPGSPIPLFTHAAPLPDYQDTPPPGNTVKNDLKPCPFCGNSAILEDHRLCWFVRCSSCGAGVMGDRAPEPEQDFPDSYWESFRQSAVEKWNHRTTPAPVPVSKRLPEATDCDEKGRCWVGYGEAADEYDSKDQELNPSWELCKVHPQDEFWLPAHSLPIPSQL